MSVEGRYYSVYKEDLPLYVETYDHTTFYVSKCNIKDHSGVVIGYVKVPNVCARDYVRKYLLIAVELMMTARTLVLEEVPVFIECDGTFTKTGQVFGRRI